MLQLAYFCASSKESFETSYASKKAGGCETVGFYAVDLWKKGLSAQEHGDVVDIGAGRPGHEQRIHRLKQGIGVVASQ